MNRGDLGWRRNRITLVLSMSLIAATVYVAVVVSMLLAPGCGEANGIDTCGGTSRILYHLVRPWGAS